MAESHRQYMILSRLALGATVFVFVCIAAFPAAIAAGSRPAVAAEQYVVHDRILIQGNGGFTAENGVVQGDGSVSNPYVISGWDIDATAGHGIEVRYTTAFFVIRDVCIHSGFDSCGAYMYRATNGAIERSTFYDNYAGIELTSCTAISIVDNAFINNRIGVYVTYDGNDVVVSGNEFSNSWEGLVLAYCSDMIVTDNNFDSDGIGMYGYIVEHYNSHVIIGNTVNGLPILYYKDSTGVSISGEDIGELIIANCADVTISGLQIQNVESAILMGFVYGALVEDCVISSCSYRGMSIMYSTDVEIKSCIVQSNAIVGISANDVTRFAISNSVIEQNGNAIMIWSGSLVTIESNTVTENGNEIYLADTTLAVLAYNSISGNWGGSFFTQCSNIVVKDNLFCYSASGLLIGDTTGLTAQGNVFWGNGLTIFGDEVNEYNSHTIAEDNFVNGKPLRYYKDLPKLVINGEETGQLIVVNCVDVQIRNLRMEPVDYAVEIAFCDLVSMKSCWISGYDALVVEHSSRVAVSDCRVSSEWGVAILGSDSTGLTIVGNSMNAPNDYAILLYSCSVAKIVGNKIVSPEEYGIGLEECENVVVNGNRMTTP